VDEKNNDGNTPLHLAASKNRINVVKKLLQYKAQKDIRNNLNKTALQLAEERHYDDLIDLLS